MIKNYLVKLEEQISLFDNIISIYTLTIKNYSSTKGYISGELKFIDDSRLSFKEIKDTEQKTKDKYAYNYLDEKNGLIFRYDNAFHHPEISTFPHHKHVSNKIIDSEEPELIDILIEISKFINDVNPEL